MATHEDRIRQRAYEIWEQEGRPHGDDLKHWMQAFKEIAEGGDPARAKAARTKKAAAAASRPAAKKKSSASAEEKKSDPASQSVPTLSKSAKPGRGVTTH